MLAAENKTNWARRKTRQYQHPVVKADARVDITNYLNLQYVGPLYMGSANQKVNVIWDTGSDWLVLDTDFCTNCIQPVFNTASSTSFTKLNTYVIQQVYGSASLYGYRATDTASA